MDCFLADLLRREAGNVIEIQSPDKLESNIQKLHDCLLELSRIEYARHAWVSAGSVAAELGRILEERRSG